MVAVYGLGRIQHNYLEKYKSAAFLRGLFFVFCPQIWSQIIEILFSFIFLLSGGLLFKVFIVGHIVKVVRRLSLANVYENQSGTGITPFPRISCSTGYADMELLDPIVSGELSVLY